MKYRIIDDLTSDVMFEAYGKDLAELFSNAAEAMFSIICKQDEIGETESREIIVEGETPDELMINWLQELIAIVDTDELFLKHFEIIKINETSLKAIVHGETITPEKGETVVKAVTYYKFKLEKTEKGYITTVSLDI